MRLELLSGWFGPGKSGATLTLQLEENDVRALCRRFGCRPFELGPKLVAVLDGTLTDQLSKGQLGLDADELVAAGDIEVGRNPDELPGIVRGAGAYFHSIEGQGDRL